MLPSSPIVAWFITYRYPIALPLAFVEGPIVMLLSGILVRAGFFDFWPIYLLLLAGDLIGDATWYWIGRRGGRSFIKKYGKFVSVTNERIEKVETFFQNYHTSILFISKITMGFGFAIATLMAAGAARVNFRKYMFINFLGGFIWTGFLIGIGYFLGNLYVAIDKGLRWMFILAVIAIGLAAAYGFGRFMRGRFGGRME